MSAVQVEHADAAVAAAIGAALREYEVGPHLVIRLVRALQVATPATVEDLLANLPVRPMFADKYADEDEMLAEVEPEELADVVDELLRAAAGEAVPA